MLSPRRGFDRVALLGRPRSRPASRKKPLITLEADPLLGRQNDRDEVRCQPNFYTLCHLGSSLIYIKWANFRHDPKIVQFQGHVI
jgi:hypothetical protein